jgi:CheY-like chemotaxis protein
MPNAGHILIADDDSDYAVLVQIALTQAGIYNPVEIVNNGLEVVQYLKGEGPYADRGAHPIPRLLLLDVRLPLRHGFDVLRWIRRQPQFRDLAVAMLSGSGFENEAQVAKDLGATTFLVKPLRFEVLVEMLKEHRDSWLPPETHVRPDWKVVANASNLVEAPKRRARTVVSE